MSAAVKPDVTAVARGRIVANAADATAAVVAVAAMNVAIVLKVAQRAAVKIAMKAVRKAEAMSALNAVTSRVARSSATWSRVMSNVPGSATSNAMSSAVNHAARARARSSASHAHHVSRVKVVVLSAHAVSAANAMNEAMSSAHRWTPLSRTLLWPTRPPWLRPWAQRHQMLARMPRAVSVANVVVATTAVLNRVKIARTSVMRPPSQQPARTRTPRRTTRYQPLKATRLTSDVDAATAMAANAASAMRVVKARANAQGASQTALKPRVLPKIQCQMRLQPNKYERKQLLNL